MTRRRRYLQNAALLTASSLVLRLLGMGFRVILSAYLGGEGMGLYQLIMALYAVFIALATAGVNVASTRLAAQSLARGQGLGTTARRLCTTALLFGTAAMAAQSLLAGPLARWLLHGVRTGDKPVINDAVAMLEDLAAQVGDAPLVEPATPRLAPVPGVREPAEPDAITNPVAMVRVDDGES